jgi:hypothetical protein
MMRRSRVIGLLSDLWWRFGISVFCHDDVQLGNSVAFISSFQYNLNLLTLVDPGRYAGLAQLFRARPCQGRGHGLESRDPHQKMWRVLYYSWLPMKLDLLPVLI